LVPQRRSLLRGLREEYEGVFLPDERERCLGTTPTRVCARDVPEITHLYKRGGQTEGETELLDQGKRECF